MNHYLPLNVALILLGAFAAALAACSTRHEVVVRQAAPMEINVNLTGRLELVVTDARDDLAEITGDAPKRRVTAEDIGLPPSVTSTPEPRSGLRMREGDLAYMMTNFAPADDDREAALKRAMADRYPQIRKLLSAHKLGESHTGLLVAREALKPAEADLMAAENKDRAAFYQLMAQRRGASVSEVALGYYIARLEHAEKGDWVQRFNKQTEQWEWIRWRE